jgi:hypothetical protein
LNRKICKIVSYFPDGKGIQQESKQDFLTHFASLKLQTEVQCCEKKRYLALNFNKINANNHAGFYSLTKAKLVTFILP